MNMKSCERSKKWVKRLPEVVEALKNEKTRLTEKKPIDAIKDKVVEAKNQLFIQDPVEDGAQKKRDLILQ